MASNIITSSNIHYRAILELHTMRNPGRTPVRLASEVKNYLRRTSDLAPDARSPEAGGLEGVTNRHARNAFMLVSRTTTPITELYNK
jgi:hypothetical protein